VEGLKAEISFNIFISLNIYGLENVKLRFIDPEKNDD